MSEWTEKKMKETLDQVFAKAVKDQDFRRLALDDPTKAVEEVAGMPVPAGVKLRFFDPGDAHLAYLLPPMAIKDLSDEELDAVAGGYNNVGKDYCKRCGEKVYGAIEGQPCPVCGRPFNSIFR